MPFRTIVVPKRPDGTRPKRSLTSPRDRPRQVAAERRGWAAPITVDAASVLATVRSRSRCACCSSATYCAARSRRRSRSSISRLRALTAVSTAVFARAASFWSAASAGALRDEVGEGGLFGREVLAMGLEAHAIELGDRRDAARHAPHRAHVVRGQQQLHVAGAATLRQLDEPLGDARRAGDANGFERLQAFRRRVAIDRRARQRALGVAQLVLLDHAIELEPPQIAEHRARLRGEPIGLRLQGADPPLARARPASRLASAGVCAHGRAPRHHAHASRTHSTVTHTYARVRT